MGRVSRGVIVLGAAVLLGCESDDRIDELVAEATPTPTAVPEVVVFNGEGNRLNAYRVSRSEVEKRTVISSSSDPRREWPADGRDINGQICFRRTDGSELWFIAGEDTGQAGGEAQGWGVFRLLGRRFDELGAEQIGDLVPSFQPGAQPENYGCGFLPDGRLLTTDVGNQSAGPPTGQLILWFPPLDAASPAFCKIDVAIGTAQGIAIAADGSAYVASARGGGGSRSGVYRYSGSWPTGDNAGAGCGRVDVTGRPLVDSGRIEKQLFSSGPSIATAAGVVAAPNGSFFVSSVLNGVIAELDGEGVLSRVLLEPPGGGLPPFATGTPLGLGMGSDGSLYYADIGLVVGGEGGPLPRPGRDFGSLRRMRFADGAFADPEVLDDGLNFPDGIGIVELALED